MKFVTIKIAAGVFLGILAAYSVYLGFQMWEGFEQRRLDAAQQQARAMKEQELISNAADQIYRLTPEELTTRCGQPLQESHTESKAVLHYLGADGRRIRLSFDCRDRHCYFDEMRRVSNYYSLEDDDLHPAKYEWFPYIENGQKKTKIHMPDHKDQVKELPCLAGLP